LQRSKAGTASSFFFYLRAAKQRLPPAQAAAKKTKTKTKKFETHGHARAAHNGKVCLLFFSSSASTKRNRPAPSSSGLI
jgi:hypothetical protein